MRTLHCCYFAFLDPPQGIQEATGYEPNCSFTNWTSINSSHNYCCNNSLHPLYNDWIVLGLLVCPNFTVFNLLSTLLHTHTHTPWLNYFKPCLSFLLQLFASTALHALSSSLSLMLDRCLPGPFKGVREKKGSKTFLHIFYLALLCLQIPQVGGSSFLGFTPRCRPAAGGPAPLPLTKLGFPSGSFQGVGGKRASEALSFLAVFSLVFLFLLVFAQTNAHGTLGDTEPHREVFLYHFSTVDNTDFGLPSLLYRLSPQNGEIQKFTCAQVCARDLKRAQWPWNCHDAMVDKLDPSLTHRLLLFY